uniref:Putative WRKY28 n=1 Tax=Davidia involucrata TaxID=16924 RepID=A0A5B7AQU9_DAVIN
MLFMINYIYIYIYIMETKEAAAVKIEDTIRSSSSPHIINPASTNYLTAGMLDFSIDHQDEKSSLGFMELLGIQEFNPPSIFDMLLQLPSVESSAPTHTSTVPASSEISNQPTTPNYSSISSESSGAPNHEQTKPVDDDEEAEEQQQQQQRTNKQLKPKKPIIQKRQREPKFAFMTKSEVDHLEDGYRWRKYGQKAVKNSPFPRSYYRCTNATCNVKKRVERCFNDPSMVVTTYEGKHTHPSPVMPTRAGLSPAAGSGFSAEEAAQLPVQFTLLPHDQPQYYFNINCGYFSSTDPSAYIHESTPASALIIRDHGLLQDIVPSVMTRKED